MLKILFKTSIRNIVRNGSNSVINLLSLIIGIAVSIVIFTIIEYEYTFDHHHTNADQVYRVNFVQKNDWGGIDYASRTPEPLHGILRSDYPQIESVSRVLGPTLGKLFIEEIKYDQGNIFYVDEHFTKLFDQDWIQGDPETIFEDFRAIVLTESAAEKLFGDQDPIGRTINIQRRVEGVVRGIIKDPKPNTNLPYTMLAHIDMMKKIEPWYVQMNWGAMAIGSTWVKLSSDTDVPALESQMNELVTRYLPEKYHEALSFELGSLKGLHTDNRYGFGSSYTIPAETIYGLLFIGGIVLITCGINFVNLSTAQALKRGKEVGVKKILGSRGINLSGQFFLELGMVTFLAAFVSLWVAELILHEMNQLLSFISIDLSLTTNSVLFTAMITIFVTAVAGFYPVLLLTRFNPVDALRNTAFKGKNKRTLFRNALLTVQFVVSQILVIVLLVFTSQFNYISNKDLGYTTENIMTFGSFLTGFVQNFEKVNTAKTQLLSHPDIEAVSFGTGGPNANFAWNTTVIDPRDVDQRDINVDYKHVDIDYKGIFDLKMVAGTWFTPSNYLDTLQKVVVSETMVSKLGLNDNEEAVGYSLIVNGRRTRIIGVLADFHADNLKSEIRPSVFESDYEGYNEGFLKYKPGSYAAVAKHLERVSREINADYTLRYSDYADELAADYSLDRIIFQFINSVTLMAIIIGCLGLYSLITYIAQQKTKEIGIRKVIGANVNSLMLMISSRFFWTVILGFLIAAPLGYFGANVWLDSFVYRTEVGPVIFVLSLMITMLIAFLSVSYKAYKAATSNPIKSLRYE